MAQAMWRRSAATVNCRRPNASWHARWVSELPRLRLDYRAAHEFRIRRALADALAVDRGGLKFARLDDGRLPMADLSAGRFALVGAAQRSVAGPPPHVRVGNVVCHSLSGVCPDGIAREPGC